MTKNFIKKLLLVFFLLLIYSYTLVITNLPDEMVVFEGETISIRTLLGMGITAINQDTVETISNNSSSITEQTGKTTLEVSLFDSISIKNVDVDVIPKTTVIPVGDIAGVKLYTNGVLVVGMSEIEGYDNKKYKPYENSGIKEGDTIIKINENLINSTEDLITNVNNSQGKDINVEYIHQEQTKECSISPVKTGNNQYKLGLWVRDSAAGVGTVSFYEPSNDS